MNFLMKIPLRKCFNEAIVSRDINKGIGLLYYIKLRSCE